jgi:hypothetical protein
MAGFFKSLYNKITNRAEIDWDDLEADLIGADLGVRLSNEILDDLKELGREISADDVIEVTRKHVAQRLPADKPPLLPRTDGKPFVILVVGVNGTGKTGSSAVGFPSCSPPPIRSVPPPSSNSNAGATASVCPWSKARQTRIHRRFASTPTRKPLPKARSSSSATPLAVCTHVII